MENSRLRRGAGVFAARALAVAGGRDAVPLLERILAEESRYPLLQVTSAQALVALGDTDRLCDLVEMLARPQHEIQNFVPSYLIETSVTHPAETVRCMREGLTSPSPRTREATAWIAGAAGLTALEPQLVALLDDHAEAPRIAAIWALGMLAAPGSREHVARMVGDADPEVRAFATEALGRLKAKES
jgi:HEAT repeat protein